MPFASPLAFRLARPALLVAGVAGAGFALAVGCGGGGAHTSTGTFGGGGASSSSHMGNGGNGGNIFQPQVGSSSTGGGSTPSSSSGTGGSKPVCDGNPTTGPVMWAAKNDDAGGQFGLAVAADPSGNVLVAGAYSSGHPITFGSQPPTATSSYNAIFVAKLDPNGTPVWVKGFPVSGPPPGNGPPLSTARAIGADGQGNVYVAGDFTGQISFGNVALASTGGYFGDSYVLKLDPSGAVTWAKRIGETPTGSSNGPFGTQTTRTLAVHKTSTGYDVAVGGDTQGKVDLDNGTSITASSTASAAAFVVVLRSGDGSTKFGTGFGDGSTDQSVHGVAWDANGDLLVTGRAQGPITFPGMAALTPAGMQAAFVAKIKGDGSATTWAKLYGAGTAGGESVAAGPNNDVFVAGDHQGDIDFGDGALANKYGANVFVARLDTSGNHVWSHTYGDSTSQHAHAIAVDAMGRAVVAGQYSGKIDFGGGALTSAGSDDIFVAKLDTHGCQVWAHTFGDPMLQTANGLALDGAGNAFLAGNIQGAVAFGSSMLTAQGDDVFVTKIGP
jgi:hypothetical protein